MSQSNTPYDAEPTPSFPGEQEFPSVSPSIRHQLEMDAWHRYPQMAERMSRSRKKSRRQGNRKLRWQDRTLLLTGIVLLALVLLRIETAVADETAWGLELKGPGSSQTTLAINTVMKAEVTGLAARVEVSQVFTNTTDSWAEGIYRFPLPDGAAVDRLHVQVGDRIIEGEIQERDSARRVYQKALSEGITATLVEQQKQNQFKTRLANIGPGEEITVSIGFLVNVTYSEGAFSLRLPMTFTPRGGPSEHAQLTGAPLLTAAGERDDQRVELEVLVHSAIGFASMQSHYHDVQITPVNQGYRAVLANQQELANRDFELIWYPDLQSTPQSSLSTWDDGEAVYAQLMVVPPLATALDPQSREVVFIIDTSGSMEGQSIDQARSALLKGLDELQSDDMFNLLQFNSDSELLFEQSVPVSPGNLAEARNYIEDLVANGGTNPGPALHAAFNLPTQAGWLRQVIFVTDGGVSNEAELLESIAVLLDESRLFTVSIGSAPNSWFMRKAAEVGRGSHTQIGKLSEVEQRMAGLWAHIRQPALSDICVDWGTEAEFYPEIIPDLYAGEPLWVIAKMPLQPHRINICGTLNGRYWEQWTAPSVSPGNDTLATLWAQRKIEAIEDAVVFGDDAAIAQERVLDVALEYGLLTSQTSLVAVDKTPVRLPSETLNSSLVPGLLPAGSSHNLASFPQTATSWQAQFMLSALTLFIASWLLWASAGHKLSATRSQPPLEAPEPVKSAA